MAKDNKLEKQNEKLEKQNRKLKKKNKAGGKVIIFLLIVIALLAAVMFLFDPFGFGLGAPFSMSGGSQGSAPAPAAVTDTQAAETAQPEETAAPEPDYIDITVSGATYLYDGSEKTADEIVKICGDAGKSKVMVTDDSATKNAVDDLKAALDAAGIELIIAE